MGKYSEFFVEHVILLSILIYAVLYIIINGLTIKGEIKKPIILTIVIMLVGYLFVMDDFDESNIEMEQDNFIINDNITSSQNKVKYNPINKNIFKNESIFLKQSDLKNNIYRLKY